MKDELFSTDEQKYLSSYFSNKDKRLGIENTTNALEVAAFEKKLSGLVFPKEKNFYNWKSFAGSIAAAFSLGAVIANLIATPVIISGTRSIALKRDIVENDKATHVAATPDVTSSATIVSGDQLRLVGSIPAWLQIVQLASSAAEEVIVEPSDKALRIRILLPIDRPERALALKVALGLRPDVSGWITVTFSRP